MDEMNTDPRWSRRLRSVAVSLVLAAGLLALCLMVMVDRAQAQTGSLSGTATYYGSGSGAHTIWVSIYTDTQQGPLAGVGVAGPSGVFTFASLEDGTYYVYAYFDADDSGGAPDVDEPFAWYDPDGDGAPDPVAVTGGEAVGGIDVGLSDPWSPVVGLVGWVNDLAVHPTISGTVYAAAGGPGSGRATRIFTTADGGADWTPVYTAPLAYVHGLAVTGTAVYAAGEGENGRGLILASGDGGVGWTEVFTGAGQQTGAFRAVAVHPVLSGTAYAAGVELGPATGYNRTGVVYATVDGGLAWTRSLTVPAGSQGVDLYALALNPVTPTTLFAAGYASDAGSRYAVVYRSPDGGGSWTPVLTATDGPEQQFTALLVHPLTPSLVFAGSQVPKVVYRSADGGDGWEKVRYDRGFRLAVDPPDTIYAADDWREIDRSPSLGITGTWSKVGGDTPDDVRALAIDLGPTTATLIFGGKFRGVYRSADSGVQWEQGPAGMAAYDVWAAGVDPQDGDRVFVAAGPAGGLATADGGETWSVPAGLPAGVYAFAVDPADSAVVYAGASSAGGGAVLRSADGGLTFAPVYTAPVLSAGGQEHVYGLAVAPAGVGYEGLVYAAGRDEPAGGGGYGVILRGLEDGLAWSQVLTLPGSTIHTLAVSPFSPTLVYAGGEDCSAGPCEGFVVRSTDGGVGWQQVLARPQAVHSLVINPQKPHVLYVGDEHTVLKSVDGGDTWVVLQSYVQTHPNRLAVDPRVPSHVYLVAPGYVAETVDGGGTWSDWPAPVNQGTGGRSGTALAVGGTGVTQTLYAGLDGLWSYTRLAPQPGSGVTATVWPRASRGLVGGAVTVTARVVDRHGNWVADGTVVTFTSSPVGVFGGNPFTRVVAAGHAHAALTGVTTGTAWVTATAGSGLATTSVRFGHRSRFISERIVAGLAQPTFIDWAPDGTAFIGHQDGRVLVYTAGQLLPEPFIDLSDQVNNNWNRGLIGLAVHPAFPSPSYVYLSYTYDPPELPGYDNTVDGRDGWGARVSRVVRVSAFATDTHQADPATLYPLLGDYDAYSITQYLPDPADPGGERVVAACEVGGEPMTDCLPSEGPSHSIGMVAFGHDGSLFVTNGEGAPYILPDRRAVRALDVDSLGGKVLRIDPVSGQGYADNPFYDGDPDSNRSKVWSLGLRNPFRFAMDPFTNTLYVGDVGWFSWEEINRVAWTDVGSGMARNFGWPCYEGGDAGNVRHPLYQSYTPTLPACGPLYAAEPDNGVQAPLYAYRNPGVAFGGAAVAPGEVYSGTSYPITYNHNLFFADYGANTINRLAFAEPDVVTPHVLLEEASSLGLPVQVAQGPDGYLYYVALNPDPSGESEIRRIRYTDDPTARAGATPTDGHVPLTVHFSSAGTEDPNGSADDLAYLWAFGDGVTSTLRHPWHTYTVSDTYTVALTVTNGRGGMGSDRLLVTVGNLAPTAFITAPTAGITYTMGTTVPFSGGAVDVEDGPLPAGSLRWSARIYYNNHFHPPFSFERFKAEGAFTIPGHNDDTSVLICLTASDSGGLEDEACVEIFPRTAVYTFDTDPSGLQLGYEGIFRTTPFTVAMPVNGSRTASAPAAQAGLSFVSWSDGGAASHTIYGQATGQTLTATYRALVRLPLVLRGYGP